MTVITKAIGEKKLADKMERPLVTDTENSGNRDPKADPEAQHPPRDMAGHYLILRRPHLNPHSMTLYCLIFTSLLGMSLGVLGGVCIYRRYAREQMHRFRTGWYSIPYERSDNKMPFVSDELSAGLPGDTDFFKSLARDTEQEALVLDKSAQTNIRDFLQQQSKIFSKNFFREYFEIDLENERYERIDVPDFRDGRQGRFIHDFNVNLTGIIDLSGHCCFVMPLNRDRVLLPRNMYDLLNKMYNGYYELNTEVIRKTMRAVFPAIEDRESVGTYIGRECENMPIYQLEKINSTNTGGMVKRSIGGDVFGHFAGSNIVEYDIININEVQKKSGMNIN
ncbi:hypothetical protein PV325_013109 [Microctonus aethiopoides]|uniref:Integral membrane protein 2 n=1 Tax=Microctonus aethiopoides TaxID=144406 RepID=A0AA39FLM9_9HYME|nr:hypothetical protein PV325_013109 [Microctonus aethiopoides]KAK0092255.1 hypothetical protein PV326_001829 [Microctonus aethiopoides]KAK0171892.1 hypothetical protein PV328_005284 [Microctonus aethiopoides]